MAGPIEVGQSAGRDPAVWGAMATWDFKARPGAARTDWSAATLRWSGLALAAASWFSAAFFGVFILVFYLGAAPAGRLAVWNSNLPRLYEPGHPLALWSIGAHFATGAALLLLGPVQLIGAVRRRWPGVHRWVGRFYVSAAGIAGLGGLGFILAEGTVGGPPMSVGFGLYGALMVIAAAWTWRLARAGRFEAHRAWAIRLYALAVASWLYRMEYGFWLPLTHHAGHTESFTGPFDVVMAFFFYVPNLLVAELFIRAAPSKLGPAVRVTVAAGLNLATAVVLLGTYYFARYYWGPGILGG